MTHITLQVPWPPTGNHAYTVARGRKILSSKGRVYRDQVAVMIAAAARGERLAGRLSVRIEAYPPDNRVRDLDNLIKLPIDCVKRAGVIADDGDIDLLSIERGYTCKGGALWIRISSLERQDNPRAYLYWTT